MGIMLVYDITNEKSFDNIKNWIRNATCKLIKFCLPSSLLLFEHYFPKLLILSSVKIFYILFFFMGRERLCNYFYATVT